MAFVLSFTTAAGTEVEGGWGSSFSAFCFLSCVFGIEVEVGVLSAAEVVDDVKASVAAGWIDMRILDLRFKDK